MYEQLTREAYYKNFEAILYQLSLHLPIDTIVLNYMGRKVTHIKYMYNGLVR